MDINKNNVEKRKSSKKVPKNFTNDINDIGRISEKSTVKKFLKKKIQIKVNILFILMNHLIWWLEIMILLLILFLMKLLNIKINDVLFIVKFI